MMLLVSGLLAAGTAQADCTQENGTFTCEYEFTSDGSLNLPEVLGDLGEPEDNYTLSEIEYLVIGGGAGGGGGDGNGGGGGGAGGFQEGRVGINPNDTLNIRVGDGGPGGSRWGSDGGSSWIDHQAGRITAIGGGGGARGESGGNASGRDGASGGGGSRYGRGGSGESGQGNSGGKGGSSTGGSAAGGGGGAGGSGDRARGRDAGDGGAGKQSALFGGTYAAGGGGGNNRDGHRGRGGDGGGGRGGHGNNNWNGGNGAANTGSGGGGGGSSFSWRGSDGTRGGDGGSGVVKIRFTAQQIPDTRTTTIEENGRTFVVKEFLATEAHEFVVPEGVTEVEYLVVGGGGAGGSGTADGNAKGSGGGGAGGFVRGARQVEPGEVLDITVGEGGPRLDTAADALGNSGTSSFLGGIEALGGGGGGTFADDGLPGGSGGGGGGRNDGSQGGAGEAGQGFGGGGVTSSTTAGEASGGGGGGAGGPGIDGYIAETWGGGGDGGAGLASTITGELQWYAGGGGGGRVAGNNDHDHSGLGGLGGGGAGSPSEGADGLSGGANTGGGGGGVGRTDNTNGSLGGAGGSGIVIVRYALPDEAFERPNQGTVTIPELPRIKGGDTQQLSVALSGFDGASELLAFVRLSDNSGSLAITETQGLTLEFGYDSFAGEPIIGFRGDRADVATALAEHLEWTAPLSRRDVELQISITEAAEGVFYNPDNGHYYQPVAPGSETTWTQARDAAAAADLFAMTGYLATITSATENDFIANRVDAENLWIGASDEFNAINTACGDTTYNAQGEFGVDGSSHTDNYDPDHQGYSEGRWYWVTGPEACSQFWAGEAEGDTVAGRFARWSDGEPNDFDGGEHFAAINFNSANTPEDEKELGFWNDFADGNTSANNYLIEFGGLPGEVNQAHFGEGSALLRSTDSISVDELSAPLGATEPSKVAMTLPAQLSGETVALEAHLEIPQTGGSLSLTDTTGLTDLGDGFTEQAVLHFHGSATDVRAALDNIEWQAGSMADFYIFDVTIEPRAEVGNFLKATGMTTFAVSEAPGQPSGVEAEPGNLQATVSWDAPEAGGSPITHYEVEAINGGEMHSCQSADGRETTCTVTGLSNGITYDVRVRASNAEGDGDWSASVPVTPISNISVSAPSSATEVVSDDGSVTTSYTNLDGDTVQVTNHGDNSTSGTFTLEGSNGQTSAMHFDGGESDVTINPDGSISSVNTTNGVTTRTTVHTDGSISYCQDNGGVCSEDESLPPGSTLRVNEDGELIVVEEGEFPPRSNDSDGTLNVCYAHDDFNSGLLTGWEILASTNYTPQIERVGNDPNNQRLRLTDVGGNRATGISKDVPIPSNGRVELDFVAHIHGGSGADGLAVVLSDWNETLPAVGAAGGSLGYAQKSGVNGFADGWLGIGIDSWGNFANPSEGRIGGPGSRRNAVSLRGSGNDQSGYRYLTGTPANLQPKLDGSANGHRYLVSIDATNSVEGEISVTVRRATDPESDNYETLIDGVNVLADGFDQRAIPAQFRLSLTASTGGANNYHELSSLRVAASGCEAVDSPTITTQAGEEPIQWDSSSSLVQTIDHDGEGELFVTGGDGERFEIRNSNELHFRDGQPEASDTYGVTVGIQDDRGNRDSETYAIDVDLGEVNETPNAPQNLTGSAGIERAALRWDFPDNADEVDLADFTVYGSKQGDPEVEYPVIRSWQEFLVDDNDDRLKEQVLEDDGPWCKLEGTGETLSCVIEVHQGMEAADYSFEVTATNTDDQEGPRSNAVTVTPFVLTGSGTEADPWEITNADEFDLVGTHLGGGSNAHYNLTDDVDLTGVDRQPIGSAESPFTGSLTSSVAGESRNISGLDGKPLFDVIGPGATVADLTIKGSVNDDAGDNAGLLANAIKGEKADEAIINNVLIDEESAITGDSFIGGLAGTIEHANINGSIIDADVTGSGDYVGGVGGTIGDSTIEEAIVNGDIKGNDYVGGVGGKIDDSELRTIEVNGGVQGEGSNVGGVGGQINRSDNASCVLETIRTNGNVSGGNKTGGVGGSIDGCAVSDVEVNGDVTGGDETGGVGGNVEDSTIDDTTVNGRIQGNNQTGGIGGNVHKSTISNSTVDESATVEGADEVGGIAGSVSDSDGDNNTVNADVTGDQNVGAISGRASNSSVSGDTSGATVETTGKGSEANPYLITEWGHLHAIRNNPDAFHRLDADLDSSSAGYAEFASATANGDQGWQPIVNFTGNLDGNNHSISGLRIARAAEANVGLFADLGAEAVVKDLTLVDVDIVGGDQTGTLAARSRGDISNVHVSGQVEGDQRNTAGLIALVTGGSVIDSTTDVAVVKQSTANGNSGGLIGDLVHSGDAITVENVRAEGDVTTQGGNAGGLIGLIEGDVTVRNAAATGTVSGISYQGGLVGYVWRGGVEKSFATGDVNGTSHLGGLIGEIWDGSVVDSYAMGAVGENGSNQVGGLIGSLGGNSELATSYATGQVTGDADLGGLVGSESGSTTVSAAYFDSTVNSSGMGDEVYGRATTELASIATFRDDWSIVISDALEYGPPQLEWHANTGAGVTWVIQPFNDGNGEEGTPYVIETAEQLALINDDVTAHYRLAGDVDVAELDGSWQPIGSDAEPFTGSLRSGDGTPRAISGLEGEPLFDEIGPGAEVSDLIVAGSVNADAGDNAGLLANAIRGSEDESAVIDNILVDADSSISGGDFVGGLAGTIEHATLTDVTVDGETQGNDNVGGVSGAISDSALTNTTVNGDVTGNNNVAAVGGTIGDSLVTNTTTNGDVQGSGSNVGSVAGQASLSANATCVLDAIQANGNVKGGNNTGGVGGSIDGCSVENALVTGTVEGDSQVGGIAGDLQDATVSNVTVDNNVTGTSDVGGVAGNATNATIDGATVNAGVSATGDRAGGINGRMTDTDVSDAAVSGAVSGANEVGGVAGNMSGGSINDAPAGISASGTGDDVNDVAGITSDGAVITHSITVSASAGGTMDPGGALIEDGESADFTVMPDGGHVIQSVTGCDGSLTGDVFSTGAITTACTIEAVFARVGDSGKGTVDDPFVISDGADLSNIADHLNSHFVLDGGAEAALDVGADWQPLGAEDAPFTGSIKGKDGDAVTVNGLGGEPLFDEIGPGADISDLVIAGSINDNAEAGSGLFANTIKGEEGNEARLRNITIDGNSRIDGGVNHNIGGLAGTIEHGDLEGITMDAEVRGGDSVGGIGGDIANSDVADSVVNGNVDGDNKVGGIGGTISDNSLIRDSAVNGNVTGRDQVGGVAGSGSDSAIEETTVNGDVLGDSNVGDIVGSEENVAITNSVSTGGVSCQADMTGLGTSDDPCQVTSWSQLASVAEALDRHYQLMNSLGPNDAGYDQFASATANDNKGWAPLGHSQDEYFTGHLDGAGHTIEGMVIDRAGESQVGLLGALGAGGSIDNVTLEAVSVKGNSSVGALVGQSDDGIVSRSSVTGTVEGDGLVGGLVGFNNRDAQVNDSSSAANVSGDGWQVGGLVGANEAHVSRSTASGDVSGDGNVGGLVGNNQEATVSDSSATGSVKGVSWGVGGLVGQNADGTVNNSYATGFVEGTMQGDGSVGGLIGYSDDAVSNSYATGDVSAKDAANVGGLIGFNVGAVSHSYAVGSVEGNEAVGGFIGWNHVDDTIQDSYWDTESSGLAAGVGEGDPAVVEGFATEHMKGEEAEANLTGLDFADIWNVVDEETNGDRTISYPFLRSNHQQPEPGLKTIASPFAGGDGSAEAPFVIDTGEALARIADHPDSHFVLDGGGDGTLDVGADWQPIDPMFTGSLKGKDGETVALTGLEGEPLFREIGPGAEISNLTIQGSQNADAGDNAGLLADAITGAENDPVLLTDVTVDADSSISGGDFVGGLAGTMEHAELDGVTVDADVSGDNNVGGIAGRISDSTLNDTSVNGDVTGTGEQVGGVGGSVTDSDLSGSTVTGNVEGGSQVGGVGGSIEGGTTDDSTIEGDVTGSGDEVGGIGGRITGGDVSNGEVNGNVTGNDQVGGIGGNVTDSTLSDSVVNGEVTGDGDNVDAVAGTIDENSTVDNVEDGSTDEGDGPVERTLLDANGDPIDDRPLSTGEEVRIVLDGAALPVSVSGSVTRGDDTLTLEDGEENGVVLTDPEDGNVVLRRDEDDFLFSADRGGIYELVFEDGEAETFTIEFEVRPQVAFSSTRQLGTSGAEVRVRAVLEGTPGQYPVRVPYEVAGHDLLASSELDADGVFEFEEGDQRSLTLRLTPGSNAGDVTITLAQGDGPEDAILGDPFVHQVVLREAAEVPLFGRVGARQGGDSLVHGLVVQSDGLVTLSARDMDGDLFSDGDHSFDWSESQLALDIHNDTGSEVTIDPDLLTAGQAYRVRLRVSEDGGRSVKAQMRLRILDSDDVDTFDEFMAFLDEDPTRASRLPICAEGDGDFRGVSDRACSRVDRSEQGVFLEAPEGYTLALGSMSDPASWNTGDFGLELVSDELIDESGAPVGNPNDVGFDHIGFAVDFELSDLEFPGQSVPVVVPLPAGEEIPEDAVWRKFVDGSWRSFHEDDANQLSSAPASGGEGRCPWVGSDLWTPDLTEGDNCVRLILEDGGPNDFDGETDGILRDPGTLAVASQSTGGDDVTTLRSKGGGAAVNTLVLLGLALLLALRYRRPLLVMVLLAGSGTAVASESPDYRWYLGGQIGWGMTDVSDSDIDRRLENQGLDGEGEVSDEDRLGFKVYLGYQWAERWGIRPALELGYLNLRPIKTELRNTSGDPSPDDLRRIRPGTGDGAELAAVARYGLGQDWHLLGRVGVLYWQSQHDISGQSSDTNRGADLFFGLGAEYRFHPRWSARLSWDRYTVENDDTDFIGLGVNYHFGGGTAVASAPRAEPSPAPETRKPRLSPPLPLVEPPPAEPETWTVRFGVDDSDGIERPMLWQEIAQRMRDHPNAHLHVVGYSSNTGPVTHNKILSERRAERVKDILVAQGVEAERISHRGLGVAFPVADNSTAQGRALNRRVEIRLEP